MYYSILQHAQYALCQKDQFNYTQQQYMYRTELDNVYIQNCVHLVQIVAYMTLYVSQNNMLMYTI